MCGLVLLHFILNFRLYLGEWKSLTRKKPLDAEAGIEAKTMAPGPSLIRKFFARFGLVDLMVIALMGALGIAVKAVITPLVHIITGPLFIPGGVVAGGVYMMFLVLAASLTGIRGAAALCGLCQGIMVLFVAVAGSHGALSIVSYTLTGAAVDLLMLLIRHKGCCALCCFFGGMAANIAGTLIVNSAFFSMPFVPLMLSLAAGALSGGLGGALAWAVASQLRKYRVAR
jgi:hypothetical protein